MHAHGKLLVGLKGVHLLRTALSIVMSALYHHQRNRRPPLRFRLHDCTVQVMQVKVIYALGTGREEGGGAGQSGLLLVEDSHAILLDMRFTRAAFLLLREV